MHRRDHGLRVAHARRVQRRHDRGRPGSERTSPLRPSSSSASRTGVRLTPSQVGELGVAQLLVRGEGAVHDRVAETIEHFVAQQRARGERDRWNRHAIYCIRSPQRHVKSARLGLILVVTRLSHYFLRTLREDPADAEVSSHRWLVRAGYIRRQAPGIFAWLPLGLRVKAKIEGIIRDEMTNAGAYEVHFPALLPRDPYESDRPLGDVRRRHLPSARTARAPTTCSPRRTKRSSRCS